MALFVALAAVAVALLVMPDVFSELMRAAIDNPGYGLGFLALLVLVGAWIDKR